MLYENNSYDIYDLIEYNTPSPAGNSGLSFLRPQWTAVVGQSRAAYCGIDPTADSLHVGNLLPLSMLMRLQTEGLTPVAVLGDVTARLGDPSGHSTSREPISKEEISANCERLEENLERLFSNFRT